MLFGVPDVITDITRSSGMVRRYRLIYRTMLFGHRKGFGLYQVTIGSPEGVPVGPGRSMGLIDQGEAHTSPQGGWHALSLATGPRGRKGGGLAHPAFPS